MPRKKLIRRFEPTYMVSQEMVDREAKYVHLEHADYLLGSTHDLKTSSSSNGDRCGDKSMRPQNL